MSAEELFDVVDSADQVIEVRPRSEVHQLGLRHRAVHIFLFRSDGQMLIHLRSDEKEEFPSVWTSSASGHVSAGESYDSSAARELQEELGIAADLQFIMKVDACPDTSNEFTQLYVAHSDFPVAYDPVEISDVRWMPPQNVGDEVRCSPDRFSPAFRLLFGAWQTQHFTH